MTSRPFVDPELAALLDQVPTVKLTEEIVKQVRAMGQTQTLLTLPTFPDIEVTECFVPGPEGAPKVRVLLYLPIMVEGSRPTFINVGALDLFLEEDLEYARRFTRAGVPTEFHLYPGAYHGFRMVADAQVTQTAARDQLAALKRALGDPHRTDGKSVF